MGGLELPPMLTTDGRRVARASFGAVMAFGTSARAIAAHLARRCAESPGGACQWCRRTKWAHVPKRAEHAPRHRSEISKCGESAGGTRHRQRRPRSAIRAALARRARRRLLCILVHARTA
eukprot:5586138-Prymnesium_polylepis.1